MWLLARPKFPRLVLLLKGVIKEIVYDTIRTEKKNSEYICLLIGQGITNGVTENVYLNTTGFAHEKERDHIKNRKNPKKFIELIISAHCHVKCSQFRNRRGGKNLK